MLIDDRRGNCAWDIAEIGPSEAQQITAELTARGWPSDAAGCPRWLRPTRSDLHGYEPGA
jgi:hypothetical protein